MARVKVVTCDGCGATARADGARPWPWRRVRYGRDYCPACEAAGNMAGRDRGHCRACGGLFTLNPMSGRVRVHGYRRPAEGRQSAPCAGAGKLPR